MNPQEYINPQKLIAANMIEMVVDDNTSIYTWK